MLFWSHGCRVFRCPTYAKFAFCCISLPCPMASHGAPGPLVELQRGHGLWVPVWKTEYVKLCVSTRHVDVTQLPLQSRCLPSKRSIYNIQRQSKSAPAIIVWWLPGTTLSYDIFCGPGELLSPRLSAPTQSFLLPYLSLSNETVHHGHATDWFLKQWDSVGWQWRLHARARTHKQIYTQNLPVFKGKFEPFLLTWAYTRLVRASAQALIKLMFQNLYLKKDVVFIFVRHSEVEL